MTLVQDDAVLLISVVGDLTFTTPTHRMTPFVFLAHTGSCIQGRAHCHAQKPFIEAFNTRSHTQTDMGYVRMAYKSSAARDLREMMLNSAEG